jgi:FAD synthetase
MPPRIMLFGTFDLLHPGHEFILKEAGTRGDVTVIVARDANVERIKRKKTTHSEQERVDAIKKTFPTYDVRLGNPTDFMAPIRETKPDLILLGYDQRMPPTVTEADFGCRVERLPALEPHKYKTSLMKKVD